jgi:hypothetical protein
MLSTYRYAQVSQVVHPSCNRMRLALVQQIKPATKSNLANDILCHITLQH